MGKRISPFFVGCLDVEGVGGERVAIDGRTGKGVRCLARVLPRVPAGAVLCGGLAKLNTACKRLGTRHGSVVVRPGGPIVDKGYGSPGRKGSGLFNIFSNICTSSVITCVREDVGRDGRFGVLAAPRDFRGIRRTFRRVSVSVHCGDFLLFSRYRGVIGSSNFHPSVALPVSLFFRYRRGTLMSTAPVRFASPHFRRRGFRAVAVGPAFSCMGNVGLRTAGGLLRTTGRIFTNLGNGYFMFYGSASAVCSLVRRLNLLSRSTMFYSRGDIRGLGRLGFRGISSV